MEDEDHQGVEGAGRVGRVGVYGAGGGAGVAGEPSVGRVEQLRFRGGQAGAIRERAGEVDHGEEFMEGYVCSVRKNNAKYARGAFDFLAAYVIPEDVWYIVPAKKLAGRGVVTLCSNSGEANFEEYREAWHLLREAAGVEEETAAAHPEESAAAEEEVAMGPGVERMQNSFDFFRRQLG